MTADGPNMALLMYILVDTLRLLQGGSFNFETVSIVKEKIASDFRGRRLETKRRRAQAPLLTYPGAGLYPILTFISLGLASSFLGRMTVRMPSLKLAAAFSELTSTGSFTVREKCPYALSRT